MTAPASFLTPALRWVSPLLLLAGLSSGCTSSRMPVAAQELAVTRVYIVRHGEKDTTPGLADPALTPAGQQRALALRDTLGRQPITAVFSTATTRTRATAAPLAEKRGLTVQPYDSKQLPALAARIRREFAGQSVLVVGHSNTILETAEALGAPRPVPAVQDAEYNYLLEVRIPRDSTQAPTVQARRYGLGQP